MISRDVKVVSRDGSMQKVRLFGVKSLTFSDIRSRLTEFSSRLFTCPLPFYGDSLPQGQNKGRNPTADKRVVLFFVR